MVALTGAELLAWVEHTSDQWKELLTRQPEILAFPCDIRESKTVAQVLQHVVAVELRYAERLNDAPQTDYAEIPYDTAAAIYATHDHAMELIRPLLERDEAWWEGEIVYKTRSLGTVRFSRRTGLVQLLTHSIRHYAQLATLVRQHGVKHEWRMDYLFMGMVTTAA